MKHYAKDISNKLTFTLYYLLQRSVVQRNKSSAFCVRMFTPFSGDLQSPHAQHITWLACKMHCLGAN